MIEFDFPNTLAGMFLLILVVFVLISFLITTGVLPALIALALGAAVLYTVYVILMRVHRRFVEGSLLPTESSDSGGE